jgi:hypothetical protein
MLRRNGFSRRYSLARYRPAQRAAFERLVHSLEGKRAARLPSAGKSARRLARLTGARRRQVTQSEIGERREVTPLLRGDAEGNGARRHFCEGHFGRNDASAFTRYRRIAFRTAHFGRPST